MADVATLYARNINPEALARIKRRAASRGLTVAQYIERLAQLHEDMLVMAATNPADMTTRQAAEWSRLALEAHDLGRVVD